MGIDQKYITKNTRVKYILKDGFQVKEISDILDKKNIDYYIIYEEEWELFIKVEFKEEVDELIKAII